MLHSCLRTPSYKLHDVEKTSDGYKTERAASKVYVKEKVLGLVKSY